jgi:cation diffusion facilitator CzcD-associated flavoprotein CzcO
MTTATTPPAVTASAATTEDHEVVIVGSGFAGLGIAVQLREAGVTDLVLLERGDDVGGTWRDNSYPGAACDVPSNLYSFSFAPNPDWSSSFSPQREILDYLRGVADRYDLTPLVRLDTLVTAARFDEATARWVVETAAGPTYTARFLVSAAGPLSEPVVPDLPGLDGFPGTVFHSARWQHDHDLAGERVAVVGTGASAIQFLPHVADHADQVSLFQRTAPWVAPRVDRRFTRFERWLFRHVPLTQRLARWGIYWGREALVLGLAKHRALLRPVEAVARGHLRRQIRDPQLRAKLTPDYTIGCKRILIANDYYPTLTRDDVEVVASGVREVRGSTVVAADGTEREVDTIIFGTGFEVSQPPIARRVRGTGGRLLADAWADGMRAHLGTTVAGFPNLFLLIGPNTGLGHTSMVFMMEAQMRYLVDAITTVRERGLPAVAVRPEVVDAYDAEVQAKLADTVWTTGGCASWYLDASGRNSTLWPDYTFRFRRRTRRFRLDEHEVVHPGGAEVDAPGRDEDRVPA